MRSRFSWSSICGETSPWPREAPVVAGLRKEAPQPGSRGHWRFGVDVMWKALCNSQLESMRRLAGLPDICFFFVCV